VSLLSWLIRNAGGLSSEPSGDLRRRLAAGDAETVQEALRLLRTSNEARGWYIFEGPTCPDVLLIANDAIVVIEGKRTEKTTTTGTTWLTGRHQIWRHIDAAWEIRGRRAVYGFFIVENASDGSIPDGWRAATMACLDSIALHASFPHRSAEEVLAISRCYLGVTTWQDVCDCFSIDRRVLLDEVSSSG
jgi:hypothetical protein